MFRREPSIDPHAAVQCSLWDGMIRYLTAEACKCVMGLLGPCMPMDHWDKQSRQHGARKVFEDSSGVGLPRTSSQLMSDFF